jgi:hypothetical protein
MTLLMVKIRAGLKPEITEIDFKKEVIVAQPPGPEPRYYIGYLLEFSYFKPSR